LAGLLNHERTSRLAIIIGELHESFPTREAAVETIIDRLVNCPGELRTEWIQ
jgi:hypothetical protein